MPDNNTTASLPLVSIGVPTLNGAKRIGKALNSIFNQNYANIEIVISDNGSTDNTEEVVRSYADHDPRIKYFKQPQNGGLAFNFEFVLQNATGKYFTWLSDDDELLPNILKSYVDYLENNPDFILVCGEIGYWTGDTLTDREQNLSFTNDSPILRTMGYYIRVKEGALIYGMMRHKEASRVRFKSILGCDWHFVAALAFMGKIRQLDFVGYNKYPGGISEDFKYYARIVGEAPIWGHLPYLKMAIDAGKEILYKSPIYRELNIFKRLFGAFVSTVAVWGHYNIMIFPRIVVGKILRTLKIKTPKQKRLEALK